MNRLGRMLIAASLVALAGAASADDTGFTYKGVGLGVSMTELQAKLPDHKCMRTSCLYTDMGCVNAGSGNRVERQQACDARNSLGGARVVGARSNFRDGRLVSWDITTDSVQIDRLIAALTDRLGAPKAVSTDPVQTMSGALVENVHATWSVDGTTVEAIRHSDEVGTGLIRMVADTERAQVVIDQASKAKRDAKDF